MEKIRVSIVSYLNSKPFLYGLTHSDIINRIEISLDIPSKVASLLSYNLADVGLIPVGALYDLENSHILTNYCIGSVEKVRTVILASEVPLEKVETILMDYQSRTSVKLAKVLAKNWWKKEFNWSPTCSGFEKKSVHDTTAAVIIGDRVFEAEKKFRYIYDLSEEWYKFTGLPFVFAVWASNKPINQHFEYELNKAFEFGIANLNRVIETEKEYYPGIDILEYFKSNISFELNSEKKEGMKKFLELSKKLNPVELL